VTNFRAGRAGRAVASAAGAAVLVFLAAAPAAAHGFTGARLDSPGSGDQYDETPVASGFFEHDDTGIAAVDLRITLLARTGPEEPPGQDPCSPPTLSSLDAGGQEQFLFEVGLPALACNGEYSVGATARSRPHLVTGSVTTATVSAAFVLAAPPAVPVGVDARLDEDAREVAVTWDPNHEVDLLGYLVERAVDDGSFEVVGDTNEPSYIDEVGDEGGAHAYRVRAVRRGPNADIEAVASDASAADAVEVAAVPTASPPSTEGGDTGSGGTTAPPPSREVDLSNFGRLQDQARRPVQSSPRVTVDTGFEPTLPFQAPPPTAPEPSTTTTAAPDPADDLAVIEYEGGGGPDTEAILAPAAGALALLVGSLQLRYLLKRASVPLEQSE
jgi:hypothetical protein